MSAFLVDRIGRWAADFVPAAVHADRARASVRDFAGCVAAGSGCAELAPALVLARPGTVPVWGLRQSFDPPGAALVMGTAGSLLQLHDLHPASGVHPSSPVIAAAWSARALRPTGARPSAPDAFLHAIVAGYETTHRIAANLAPELARAGGTSTGTAGALGATVAASLVAGFDAEGIARAVSAAALLLPATPFAAMTAHSPLAALHSGLAARAAIEAVLLASHGDAGRSVLEGNAGSPGLLDLLRGSPGELGPERWDGSTLDGVCWKFFPACFGSLSALEALLRLEPVEPSRVLSLRVQLPQRMLGLIAGGPAEGHLYDRLMSLRWVLARALETGYCGPRDAGAPSAVADALATRIHVEHAPRLDAVDDAYAADLELRSDRGTQRISYRRPVAGEPVSPGARGWTRELDEPALAAKFDTLAHHCTALRKDLHNLLPD